MTPQEWKDEGVKYENKITLVRGFNPWSCKTCLWLLANHYFIKPRGVSAQRRYVAPSCHATKSFTFAMQTDCSGLIFEVLRGEFECCCYSNYQSRTHKKMEFTLQTIFCLGKSKELSLSELLCILYSNCEICRHELSENYGYMEW